MTNTINAPRHHIEIKEAKTDYISFTPPQQPLNYPTSPNTPLNCLLGGKVSLHLRPWQAMICLPLQKLLFHKNVCIWDHSTCSLSELASLALHDPSEDPSSCVLCRDEPHLINGPQLSDWMWGGQRIAALSGPFVNDVTLSILPRFVREQHYTCLHRTAGSDISECLFYKKLSNCFAKWLFLYSCQQYMKTLLVPFPCFQIWWSRLFSKSYCVV